MILRVALALCLMLSVATGAPLRAAETAPAHEWLFRGGTLDLLARDAALIYRREVRNDGNAEAADRASGDIALRITTEDGVEMAELEFRQATRHRVMGRFPASVGNPLIMVFYEQVLRDMAATAGGSPFYIRNRIKEAMRAETEIIPGTARVSGREVMTRMVRLRPFAGDPNHARMMGFGDLELSVTMSDEVPGWYLSLIADTPDGRYHSEMRYAGTEARR